MKVGKKVLSTLLAIIMIVSSVSVCFSVLGAEASIESLMSQIELHHASLIDLIEEAAKDDLTEEEAAEAAKKVISSAGTNEWAVERDTATSSWHWVTYAYAEAAKGVVGGNVDTFADIYNAIKGKIEAELDASTTGRMPLARYDEILKVFAFGEDTDANAADTVYLSGGEVSVDIKAGFNILQYKDGGYTTIPEDTKDLELYKGVLKVQKVSNGTTYGITADSIAFDSITQDAESIAGALIEVKSTIAAFISLADEWFGLNFSAMNTEELTAKVFDIAENIQSFEKSITTAGISSAEEIWDNFVMPELNVKKTWKDVQNWYSVEVLSYVAPAYAKVYQDKFEELFARANGEDTGVALLQTYNEISFEIENLKKTQVYNGKQNIEYFNNIVAAFENKEGYAGEAYYNNVLNRLSKLGNKLAETYAQENYVDFVNQFKMILDTAKTKHSLRTPEESEACGHVWEKCDGNCGKTCPGSGKVTVDADGTVKGHEFLGTDANGNEVTYICTETAAHCVHHDYNQAEAFVLEATETIAIFNTYVFPYITDSTGAIVWSYLKNLDDNAVASGALQQGEGISLDDEGNWNKFVSQYNVYSLNVGGKEYIDAKVAMDAVINGVNQAILGGATYNIIQDLYNSMLDAGYKKCSEVANDAATADLFKGIFGEEGMQPYDDFIKDLKRRAANRIYDLSQRVYDYYIEGGSSVSYWNFEIIILAYNAIVAEATPAQLGQFLRAEPAYNPDDYAEEGLTARTLEEVTERYNSIAEPLPGESTSVVTQANEFKIALETLRKTGGNDVSIRKWLFSKGNIQGAPGQGDSGTVDTNRVWKKAPDSAMSYAKIQELIDEVGLVGTAKAEALVDDLITKLDSILISEDMGSLLGGLLFGEKHKTKTNKTTGAVTYGYFGYTTQSDDSAVVFYNADANLASDTAKTVNGKVYQKIKAMTNPLGYWEKAYTFQGETKKVGQECKDLKEFLAAMIINYLYSGELATTLFKALNDMVGPML